jgi:hypothetical protein
MKRLPMERLLLLIALLSLLCPVAAIPADPPARSGTQIAEKGGPGPSGVAPATLKIQNRPIVTLRGTLLGYSPKQRVEAAESRIQLLIERGEAGPVSAVTRPEGMSVIGPFRISHKPSRKSTRQRMASCFSAP